MTQKKEMINYQNNSSSDNQIARMLMQFCNRIPINHTHTHKKKNNFTNNLVKNNAIRSKQKTNGKDNIKHYIKLMQVCGKRKKEKNTRKKS